MTNGLSRAHRAWRVLPAGVRRTGLRAVTRALAPHADTRPPDLSHGVVIAGEMSRISGLGEAARLLEVGVRALVPGVSTVKLGVLRRPVPERLPPGAAVVLHVNAPSIPLMLARAGAGYLSAHRVIGMWNWELDVLPASWAGAARYVHEIWAPSAFTAAAIGARYPGMVRVVPYPLGAIGVVATPPTRARFDLPAEAVVTVVIANLGASFARKNPLAAIAAHLAAFGDRADRILVVKLAGGAAFPADMAMLRAAIGGVGNIRLIDAVWPADRLRALLACGDILLSLHRAEGFGLVPAEAMLRGVAVVATGWSGTLQFMDARSAALVSYDLVPVADPRGDYQGVATVWAEPDVAHAAALLRGLADDPIERAALAARGRAFATAALGDGALAAALAASGIC